MSTSSDLSNLTTTTSGTSRSVRNPASPAPTAVVVFRLVCLVGRVLRLKKSLTRLQEKFSEVVSDYDPKASLRSRYLWSRNKRAHTPDIIKGAFVNTPFTPSEVKKSEAGLLLDHHPHPESAYTRNHVRDFANQLAMATGLRTFFFEQSKSDQKSNVDGNRHHYFAKDLDICPSRSHPENHHLIVIVDVDYYIDMPRLMLKYVQPFILYTFVPTAAAGMSQNSKYKFCNNELITLLGGGGSYAHELWDYGKDTIAVSGFIALQYRFVVYGVERRSVANSRQLILLVPKAHYTGLAAYIARKTVTYHHLIRFHPLHDGFNVIRVVDGDSMCVSVSRDDSWESASIPSLHDVALQGLNRIAAKGKTPLSVGTIASYMDRHETTRYLSVILQEYYVSMHDFPDGPYVYPVHYAVKPVVFKMESNEPTYENNTGIQSFMTPLIGPCYAPVRCLANDTRTITSRVVGVATQTIELDNFICRCITDFRDYFIGHKYHTLAPVNIEEVYARQNRPTQRRIIDEALIMGPNYNSNGKCFQKGEAAAKPGDPRNITTIPGVEKVEYSQFMYAFSELLKEKSWYAFGITPLIIAQRVTAICQSAHTGVALGDLSRMDGRVSNIGRLLTKTIMLSAFRPEYSQTLEKMLASQTFKKCYTREGVSFDSKQSRLSGSPETSAFNTIETAFIAYISFRSINNPLSRAFHTHDEAIALMQNGMYGGDDSVVADLPISAFQAGAARTGHVATGEFIHHGERGVNFLARYYSPEVWCGVPDSCTDIYRAAIKFHTTAKMPDNVTPLMKLVEKSRAVFATDANTPIIGQFACAALKLNRGVISGPDQSTWWSRFDAHDQYPNDNWDNWMERELLLQMPTFNTVVFAERIAAVTDIAELLRFPLSTDSTDNNDYSCDIAVHDVRGRGPPLPTIEAPQLHKAQAMISPTTPRNGLYQANLAGTSEVKACGPPQRQPVTTDVESQCAAIPVKDTDSETSSVSGASKRRTRRRKPLRK